VNDAETHHQLGDQYRLRQRYDEAIAEYRQALQLDPQHKDTLFNIAACLEYQDLLAKALETYQQAGRQDPDDMDVLYRLARINLKMGNPTRALTYIEQSQALRPDEDGYALKAKILQELGRKDDAVAVYHELIRLNPDDAEAQYELNKSLAKW